MLKSEPLTAAAFKPFGDVLGIEGARPFPINQSFAVRFNNLVTVDVAAEDGAADVSVFVANPRPQPVALKLMERHPLGSQIFYPLQDRPWLVVVCSDPHEFKTFRAFSANGLQGINYARNIWHHPLLVFDAGSRFLVVDRKGPGANLEERVLQNELICEWPLMV